MNEYDSIDNQYDKDAIYPAAEVGGVSYATLIEAIAAANGETITLVSDTILPVDTAIAIAKGKDVTLDLAGRKIYATSSVTGKNSVLFDVQGTFNVSNGTIEYAHVGDDMEWNNMTAIFSISNGGVLNMKDVVAENIGGTAMNFVVHLNNWGDVTLNADKCEFISPYCGVRVFNSGNDMNYVTIKNSTLTGGNRAFWVHNYYSENKNDDTLSIDIYNNNNVFEIANAAVSPIRYGFSEVVYYNEAGQRLLANITFDSESDLVELDPTPADGVNNSGLAIENGVAVVNKEGAWSTGDVDVENKTYTIYYEVDLSKLPAGENNWISFDGGNNGWWADRFVYLFADKAIIGKGITPTEANTDKSMTLNGTKVSVTYTFASEDGKWVTTASVNDGINSITSTHTPTQNAGTDYDYTWCIYNVMGEAVGNVAIDNFSITAK